MIRLESGVAVMYLACMFHISLGLLYELTTQCPVVRGFQEKNRNPLGYLPCHVIHLGFLNNLNSSTFVTFILLAKEWNQFTKETATNLQGMGKDMGQPPKDYFLIISAWSSTSLTVFWFRFLFLIPPHLRRSRDDFREQPRVWCAFWNLLPWGFLLSRGCPWQHGEADERISWYEYEDEDDNHVWYLPNLNQPGWYHLFMRVPYDCSFW